MSADSERELLDRLSIELDVSGEELRSLGRLTRVSFGQPNKPVPRWAAIRYEALTAYREVIAEQHLRLFNEVYPARREEG